MTDTGNMSEAAHPLDRDMRDSLIYNIALCFDRDTLYLAAELDKSVKLFNRWYEERYMKGDIGDYIACREDDIYDFILSDVTSLT